MMNARAAAFGALLVALFAGSLFPAHADDAAPPDTRTGRLSLETSLSFPAAARIYLAQAAWRFDDRNEGIVGFCYQNWSGMGTLDGEAHADTLILGYRFYAWDGLHLELELFPAWNAFVSGVDGKTYEGFETWIEYRVGWKARFEVGGRACYLLIQPGIGHALYLQNIWPGLNKDSYWLDSLMFIPELCVGISL